MQHLDKKKFGSHIKKLREKKGITLNKLAFENDINKSTLSRLENGSIEPKLSTIQKLAEGLGISYNELLNF